MRIALTLLLLFSSFVEASTIQRALALAISRDDFPALSHGVETAYFAQPFKGEVRGGAGGMGEFRFDALQYQFSLRDLQLTPRHGALQVALNLREASIHFNTIHVTDRIECHGLRATSFSNAIPVTIELIPQLTPGQGLRFEARAVSVDVNPRNFHFQSLDACSGLGPLNAVVERLVLRTANTMQAKVGETIATQIAQQAALLNAQLSSLFSLNVSLPFMPPTVASFLVGARIFPSEVELEGDRAFLVVGAGFVDDNSTPSVRPGFSLTDLRGFRAPGGESYLALSTDFVNLGLRQANAHGFFRTRINAQTQPAAAMILNAAALQSLIPDSIDRFEPTLPLELVVDGLDSLTVTPKQTGPNKIELTTAYRGLRLHDLVDGKPYYDFTISGEVPLNLKLKTSRQHLLFMLPSLGSVALQSASFAPGLVPPPQPGSGMTQQTLDDYWVALGSLLGGNNDASAFMDLRLPLLQIGYTQILYRDLLVQQPFVAVGFTIWR